MAAVSQRRMRFLALALAYCLLKLSAGELVVEKKRQQDRGAEESRIRWHSDHIKQEESAPTPQRVYEHDLDDGYWQAMFEDRGVVTPPTLEHLAQQQQEPSLSFSKNHHHIPNHATNSSLRSDDKKIRDLIVGGSLAEAGEFPWYVSATGGFCGGSLVDPSVVLTAAHCGSLFAVGKDVWVGAFRRNSNQAGAVKREIARHIIHPEYNGDNFHYDFMLLQLSEPVTGVELLEWNRETHTPVAEEHVVVMGFGRTAVGGAPSQELKLLKGMQVVDNEICLTRFGRTNFFVESMLGAMHPTEEEGPCQGDSGGPLVIPQVHPVTGSVSFLQVGVVSWAISCAHTFYPSVYARTGGGATEWLETHICDMSRECTLAAPIVPEPMPVTQVLLITFFYDSAPQETTWSIIEVDPLEEMEEVDIVFTGPAGHAPTPHTGFQYTVTVRPGTYRMVVFDSAGNGLEPRAGSNDWRFQIVLEINNLPNGQTVEPQTLLTGPLLSAFGSRHDSMPFTISDPLSTPRPTPLPTKRPTRQPTQSPVTAQPTRRPTQRPSASPTVSQAPSPSLPTTRRPTVQPTKRPTVQPTQRPTRAPVTPRPTPRPTVAPSKAPTEPPTAEPGPCACLTGLKGGCLQAICQQAETEQACEDRGCTWVLGNPDATPPPNLEGTDDALQQVVALGEDEDSTLEEHFPWVLAIAVFGGLVLFVVAIVAWPNECCRGRGRAPSKRQQDAAAAAAAQKPEQPRRAGGGGGWFASRAAAVATNPTYRDNTPSTKEEEEHSEFMDEAEAFVEARKHKVQQQQATGYPPTDSDRFLDEN